MININEYLLGKNNKKAMTHEVIATNDNIEKIVQEAIRNYGTGVDLNYIDTSAVTKMNSLFDQEDFEGDVSLWDVSGVTNMNYMFYKCEHFNCDLSRWEPKSLQDAHSMFKYCYEFEGHGLENWEVPNLKDAYDMFEECSNLDFDITKWKPVSLEQSQRMFFRCKKFKGKGIDTWKTPNLDNMVEMFEGCKNLDVDLSNWNLSSVTKWGFAFDGTPLDKQREKLPKFKTYC